ncbi:MAG: glutamate--tRNA ligase [Actinomycetota bacterium]|nr:glutamate--tRNA ligase [Actinomycetota bacterium]
MTEHVRVRFAPSPTGNLHIGGARTAIYNWAFARHHGGEFILRIDDTDKERSTDENTTQILRAMRWLGLDWDEGPEVGGDSGPYHQTLRGEFYADALETLKANGHAYPCFCTPEAIEAKREAARSESNFWGYDRTCRSIPRDEALARAKAGEPQVWRVKVQDELGDITINDAIRGEVSWPVNVMDDFILVRTDGSPTYMFATVVDDWKMGITHIIRGDDHLSNTPRQIAVYQALEADIPTFAHMGLIFGADGKRLSKRHGATSVESYAKEGYLSEALLNYLSLLGWSIDETTTLFDRERLIAEFDLARVSNNPSVWDPEKLEWMNGVYIRELGDEGLAQRMVPWLIEAGLLDAERAADRHEWLLELAPLISERVKTMSEIAPMVAFLFAEEVVIDEASREKVLAKEGAGRSLDVAAQLLEALDEFSAEEIEAALRSIHEITGVKAKIAFQAVRVAVTGTTVSPPLFESIALLGRERTLARIIAARTSSAL